MFMYVFSVVIRGCSPLLLSGMGETANTYGVNVWRPLLGHTKEDIYEFAHKYVLCIEPVVCVVVSLMLLLRFHTLGTSPNHILMWCFVVFVGVCLWCVVSL